MLHFIKSKRFLFFKFYPPEEDPEEHPQRLHIPNCPLSFLKTILFIVGFWYFFVSGFFLTATCVCIGIENIFAF